MSNRRVMPAGLVMCLLAAAPASAQAVAMEGVLDAPKARLSSERASGDVGRLLHWVSEAMACTFSGFFQSAAYRSDRPSFAFPIDVHLMMSPLFSLATTNSAPFPLISA